MDNINEVIMAAKKKRKLRPNEPIPPPPGSGEYADLGWLEKNKNK